MQYGPSLILTTMETSMVIIILGKTRAFWEYFRIENPMTLLHIFYIYCSTLR